MAQASACALRSTPIRMSGFFSPKNFRKYQKPQFVHLNFKALFEAQADACAMNLLLFHNENPQHIPVEFKSCNYLVLSNLKAVHGASVRLCLEKNCNQDERIIQPLSISPK